MLIEHISAQIRDERQKQHMTQAKLANASGLSRQSFVALETSNFGDLGIRKVANVWVILGMGLSVSKKYCAPLWIISLRRTKVWLSF
jgi:DNA-binding XRE family transcriptional regulator